MNKSLSSVDLSLELHVISIFGLEYDTSCTFSLYFAQLSTNLRDQPWRWCGTDICNCKLSAKVSLLLENPFPVPSLCKLNHISVFIHPDWHENHLQIARSLQRKPCFFKVIPGVLDRSVNFNITERFLLWWPLFPNYLSVSCDYD